MSIAVDLNWDVSRNQIAARLTAELENAFDLKNKRVRQLERQVETFTKRTGAAQRRVLLTSMRKRK